MGMLACLLAGVLLALTPHVSGTSERVLWIAAGLLVPFRLLCNMLDGMVAVGRGIASPVGELYNEIPDRISDMATLIGLGFATMGNPTLGAIVAALAVLVAYVRAAAKVAGAPQDYRGPMAKQQRMMVVVLVCLWMACVPRDWRLLSDRPIMGLGVSVPNVALLVIGLGCVLTAWRRTSRAASVLKATRR